MHFMHGKHIQMYENLENEVSLYSGNILCQWPGNIISFSFFFLSPSPSLSIQTEINSVFESLVWLTYSWKTSLHRVANLKSKRKWHATSKAHFLMKKKKVGCTWSRHKSMSRTNTSASVNGSTSLSISKTLFELCLCALLSVVVLKLIAILTQGKRKTTCIKMDMQVSIKMSESINRHVKQQYSFGQQELWQFLNGAYPSL